ncbi:hypothetical protein BLOT_007774 [Blomia tropicalis]|nr:hypothetical protein BLOT_007774 [Blomia tropicalis]
MTGIWMGLHFHSLLPLKMAASVDNRNFPIHSKNMIELYLLMLKTAFSDDLILLYFAEYSISSYMSKLETRGKKRPRPELASSYLKKRKFKIVRFK